MRCSPRSCFYTGLLAVLFILFVQLLRVGSKWHYVATYKCTEAGQIYVPQSENKQQNATNNLNESSVRQLRRVLYSVNDVAKRRDAAQSINHYQFVRNAGPRDSSSTSADGNAKWRGTAGGQQFVIVVQTHDRVHYLRELLASLGNVVGIERALLIVSHDFYSEEIEDLMNTVRCPLIQLFFPFAFDWFDKQYPADDWRDCRRDTPLETARKTNCTNAEWADMYGHYREAKFTQLKQHYIWKLAFVFDQLRETRDYDGPVITLEDDHLVSDDLLHAATLAFRLRLQESKKPNGPATSIVSLGNYDPVRISYARDFTRTQFLSTKHIVGMMFDRSSWNSLKSCSKEFCEYDDYNWDWTLQYLSFSDCIKGGLTVYSAALARVHHIGYCGIHYKKDSCDPAADAASVRSQLLPHRDTLHAVTSVEQVSELRPYEPHGFMKPNGGWKDPRDQELCKANMMGVQAYVTDVKESSMAVSIVKNLLRLTYSMSTAG